MLHSNLSLEGNEQLLKLLPAFKVSFTDQSKQYIYSITEVDKILSDNPELVVAKISRIQFDDSLYSNTESEVYQIKALLDAFLLALDSTSLTPDNRQMELFDRFYSFLGMLKVINEKLSGIKQQFEENFGLISRVISNKLN